MKRIELSDLDRRILDRLSTDARVSNREIARELGVTEGAIRVRLKRLTDEKAIQVTAITNYDLMPDPLVAYLWISTDAGYPLKEVIDALSAQPQITYVASLIGRADILAITWVRDASQLADYLHATVDRIPGISGIHYELTHKLIKHDYRATNIVD
ncbi:Lrp/AsnC family transcriptional regulator [Sphingomonas jatrophae]|uniref:Lrp/AsnC family transcriptional regulator, regulator for asnA, asnC and gidA n=1 Tax=Sphingomonas jatrophae TaxID=1166337 RepID=A0A1I6KB88_9SPHN|nr:Lrp/AsnC family transcriptional regulator [Sphingomonas jatrophae]SFR88481.1 Lrp/AsnC family transcriptional regulator, regulator for asnA, asnC and gidA [Sphingomonas jatrophae]